MREESKLHGAVASRKLDRPIVSLECHEACSFGDGAAVHTACCAVLCLAHGAAVERRMAVSLWGPAVSACPEWDAWCTMVSLCTLAVDSARSLVAMRTLHASATRIYPVLGHSWHTLHTSATHIHPVHQMLVAANPLSVLTNAQRYAQQAQVACTPHSAFGPSWLLHANEQFNHLRSN
jgi:hypothetical protein